MSEKSGRPKTAGRPARSDLCGGRRATGILLRSVLRPLSIDFKKASHAVLVTVSDGLNVSAPEWVTITIPDKVDVHHNGHFISVSKNAGPTHLRHGDCLGRGGSQ